MYFKKKWSICRLKRYIGKISLHVCDSFQHVPILIVIIVLKTTPISDTNFLSMGSSQQNILELFQQCVTIKLFRKYFNSFTVLDAHALIFSYLEAVASDTCAILLPKHEQQDR